MDVAQNFNKNSFIPAPEPPKSPISPRVSRSPIVSNYNVEDPGGWGESESTDQTISPAAIKTERRRSNYDKYSNFTLPVLPEEKTPIPTPVGTLTKADLTTIGSLGSGGQQFASTVQQAGSPAEVRPAKSKVYIGTYA